MAGLLPGSNFLAAIHTVCLLLELPCDRITMHSFWIGGVSGWFCRGVPPEIIKILRPWLGMMYEMYIRPPLEDCARQMQRVISDPVLPGRAAAVFSFSDPARG